MQQANRLPRLGLAAGTLALTAVAFDSASAMAGGVPAEAGVRALRNRAERRSTKSERLPGSAPRRPMGPGRGHHQHQPGQYNRVYGDEWRPDGLWFHVYDVDGHGAMNGLDPRAVLQAGLTPHGLAPETLAALPGEGRS